MLIPSIDLMGGRIVQLERGEKLRLAFDDFEYWIDRFASYPMVQLIDLDAAMRQGDNSALIAKIAERLPCQVGGGIRDVARARAILSAGARRVIIGSVLFRSDSVDTFVASLFTEALDREQWIASIDTKDGRVAVRGWKAQVELTPEQAMQQLEPFCGGFLYTHVDTEGTMQGFPFERAETLCALTRHRLIVAGGIRAQSEVDALDAIGVDAVVGMAVYSGLLAT
jgi:phosphoribosylformimino-5-aminoimidazole carboxamide ribotide isomerase